MKFTKGPWVIRESSDTSYPNLFITDERLHCVAAVIKENYMSDEEEQKNALLISISPDLYEAAKAVVEMILEGKPGDVISRLHRLRTIIKKIEQE